MYLLCSSDIRSWSLLFSVLMVAFSCRTANSIDEKSKSSCSISAGISSSVFDSRSRFFFSRTLYFPILTISEISRLLRRITCNDKWYFHCQSLVIIFLNIPQLVKLYSLYSVHIVNKPDVNLTVAGSSCCEPTSRALTSFFTIIPVCMTRFPSSSWIPLDVRLESFSRNATVVSLIPFGASSVMLWNLALITTFGLPKSFKIDYIFRAEEYTAVWWKNEEKLFWQICSIFSSSRHVMVNNLH